jgi:hypothetical protein
MEVIPRYDRWAFVIVATAISISHLSCTNQRYDIVQTNVLVVLELYFPLLSSFQIDLRLRTKWFCRQTKRCYWTQYLQQIQIQKNRCEM